MAKGRAQARTKSGTANAVPSAATPHEGSIYRQVSWWALIGMIFITPIALSNLSFLGFDLPVTFDQFDIIKLFFQRVLGLVALGAWAVDVFLYGGKIRRTNVEWLILAFLAWVAISAVLSIHPPTAIFGKYRRFEGLLSFVNYAVIYFVVMQHADRPSRIRTLAQTLFFSGVFVAGYGVLQSFGADFIRWGRLPFEANRAFATYGNPDLLGGFLMFSTFVSLALALAEERLWWRAGYWTGFLLSTWCIVVAFTRSAWVGSVVGFFFIVLFAIRQRPAWTRVDWGFSGAIGAIVALVIARSSTNPNAVMNFWARAQSIFIFDEGSALTRFEIWSAAIDAVNARPVFGFGADTFRLVFPIYKPFEYSRDAGYLSVADNVHNYPLQLAAGIGIPGVLMFYGIAAWTAVKSWPMVFNKEGGPHRMILAGFWAACAAYITHLLFGLSVTGASFLLWVSMGILLAPTATVIEVKRPSWGTIASIVMVVLVLAGAAFQVRYTMADNAYLKARVASVGQARIENAIQATRLNPFNDIYRAEVGLAWSDELVNALGSIGQGENEDTMLQAAENAFMNAEQSFRSTIDFVPAEYDNYVFLANLYNLGGQVWGPQYYEKAIVVATTGIKVERYGPAIRYQLARALEATGDKKGAETQLRFAVRLDPKYSEATLFLSRLYTDRGEFDEARKLLENAIATGVGDPALDDELRRIEASATASPE